jgi:hypothetical protein
MALDPSALRQGISSGMFIIEALCLQVPLGLGLKRATCTKYGTSASPDRRKVCPFVGKIVLEETVGGAKSSST